MLRVLLTGGGSGGHIVPLLAVADELRKSDVNISLTYFGPKNMFANEFALRDIPTYALVSSKLRRYFSLQYVLEPFRFIFGFLQALIILYRVMPDVVFSKGGPGSFAAVVCARWYMIPVIIHESDSVPGLTNRLSAIFASRIGISFESSASYFPQNKVAHVGNPVRKDLLEHVLEQDDAKEKLGFNSSRPVTIVLCGSQGAVRVNNFIVENLGTFLPVTQIYHQTGGRNIDNVLSEIRALGISTEGYHAEGFLDTNQLKIVLAAADVVISRAGSGTIFEIAAFGKPAILIPLPESANDHQRRNAYEYEKIGGAIVIDDKNFTPHVVLDAVKQFLTKKETDLSASSKTTFYRPEAAKILADQIVFLGTPRGKVSKS